MSCIFNASGTSGIDIGSGATLELTEWTVAFWFKLNNTPGLFRFLDDSVGGGSIRLRPDSTPNIVSDQITNTACVETSNCVTTVTQVP